MNKQTADLINLLADKTLSFGCRVESHMERKKYFVGKCSGKLSFVLGNDLNTTFLPFTVPHDNVFKILGHPIMIGNVLKKVKDYHMENDVDIDVYLSQVSTITFWWGIAGFTNSLQSIIEKDTKESKQLIEFLATIFL